MIQTYSKNMLQLRAATWEMYRTRNLLSEAMEFLVGAHGV